MAQLTLEFSTKIRKALADLNKIAVELARTEDSAEGAKKAVEAVGSPRAAKSFSTVRKGAANAVPTLQEFTRVIQDAPFGIQGVANNIQQLVANFGNLTRAAGGTRKALKLLFNSLAGPTGILLAVSVVTAALTAFSDQLFTSSNAADTLKNKIDALNEAFNLELERSELIEESLRLQNKSALSILQARRDIYKTQLLSLATSIQEQKLALQTLQTENKRLSGYEALSGVVSQLIEKLKVELGLAKFLNNAALRLAAFYAQLLDLDVDRIKANSATAEETQKQLDLTNEIAKLENQRLKILNDILKLEKQITAEKLRQTPQTQVQGAQRGITANLDNIGAGVSSQITGETLTTRTARQLSDLELLWVDFVTSINDLSRGDLVEGISSLGDSIGQALARGQNVFSSIGQSILSSFGQFLSNFGKQLVQYGVAALAFSNVSKGLLNPLTAGPSAAAAIAIGTALAAAGGALSSIAGGGLGGSSTVTSGDFVGSSGNFGISSSGNNVVVFEISGQKLLGVLNNVQNRNNRLGG